MPKYHLNKHGEPARCDAQIKCRVSSGDGEHFNGDIREALEWAEKKNAEESGGGSFVSTKAMGESSTISDKDIETRDLPTEENFKHSKYPTIVPAERVKEYHAIEKIESQIRQLQNEQAKLSRKPENEISLNEADVLKAQRRKLIRESSEIKQRLVDMDNANKSATTEATPRKKSVAKAPKTENATTGVDHSSSDVLRDVLTNRRAARNDGFGKEELHYSTNAGKLNPTSFKGSGSDYVDEGENSFVILSDFHGNKVRAVSSSGEFYKTPDDELGKRVTQVKQYANSGDREETLYVVGYSGQNGEKHGYIPNKQVSMFVYK